MKKNILKNLVCMLFFLLILEPIIFSPRLFAESNTIEGVEAYTWYRGCTPTTLSMIFNYHGRHEFPNLYCEPSSFHWDGPGGWIIDWLWNIPYCPRELVDEFADIYGFPESGGSEDQYGAWPNDYHAVIVVAANHGYDFNFEYIGYNPDTGQTHWPDDKYQIFEREIDHGHPIHIAYESPYGNHSICGFGYDFDDTHKIEIYNTWDRDLHVLTCENETIYCWGCIIPNQPPNTPPPPTGPGSGSPGTSYTFYTTTTDPDGDRVAFKFDWGDGSESPWTSYVDSGASVSASHSWSSEATYEVKVKAKDTYNEESGWSQAYTIVISPAPRSDLTITSISPDTVSVNSEVYIRVTVANQGTQDVTEDFWVDIYYDPSSPPDKGEYGNEMQQITQTVPTGESIQVTFTHAFSSTGDHVVWAQVDSEDFVLETDEDNNIYGPHTIVVSETRHENEVFSLPAGKWKMISVPFTLDDPSPNAVLVDDLGSQNDAVWKLYRWNTANGSYDKYPYAGDFAAGKTFWIVSKDAKEVDTGPGTDVSRETNFVINLPSGWSQIGNPFPFLVAWGEVMVRKDGEVVNISEAQGKEWVRDTIWYWDGQSYLFDQAPSGVLNPYEGYWVRALLNCELLVPPSGAQEARAWEQVIKPKEEFLQLKARVGEIEDSYNFLGFYQTAKDGYDRLDVEEAPPISPYISLFFPHPEWGKNKGDYTQDIRARIPQAAKQIWDFQVKTDQINQEIVLEWENTLAFPEDLHLYLTDSLSNVLANMREKSSYSFISSSGLESFKIVATSEALPLPEDLDLIEVYSYPNPAHGDGVRFHFHLASSAKLTIKVYSISGELVRTLIKDEVYLPGAYEELWKEDNDRGEKLARGVYVFIIQAGNPAKVMSKSGKIVLLD